MRVLGIDPGLRTTGYGCVEGDGFTPRLVEGGVIRLVRGAGPVRPIADRLVELERDAVELIDRLRPGAVAIEALFAHKAFPATAVAMGHARGVLMLCARRTGVEVLELPPRLVKKALTGSGRASKDQMQRCVQRMLGLASVPEPADVADAIAVGIAGLVRVPAS